MRIVASAHSISGAQRLRAAATPRRRSARLGQRGPYARLARLLLWAGATLTGRAEQRRTGLVTSWIFNVVGNTLLLGLPELVTATAALVRRLGRRPPRRAERVLRDLVVDNPRYLGYVAPVAGAFILAHPKFNLYRSPWANRQLFGAGLDTLPHAATAFALVNFVRDTLGVLERDLARHGRLPPAVAWAGRHADLVAAGVLALMTAGYETAEYLIYRSELRACGGDRSRVAMYWTAEDTAWDIVANAAGGLAALLCGRSSAGH